MTSNTLRFWDPVIAKRFEEFCLVNPPAGQKKYYDQDEKQFVYTNYFDTITQRTKFVADWASLTIKKEQ
jgi:hypothetical protein